MSAIREVSSLAGYVPTSLTALASEDGLSFGRNLCDGSKAYAFESKHSSGNTLGMVLQLPSGRIAAQNGCIIEEISGFGNNNRSKLAEMLHEVGDHDAAKLVSPKLNFTQLDNRIAYNSLSSCGVTTYVIKDLFPRAHFSNLEEMKTNANKRTPAHLLQNQAAQSGQASGEQALAPNEAEQGKLKRPIFTLEKNNKNKVRKKRKSRDFVKNKIDKAIEAIVYIDNDGGKVNIRNYKNKERVADEFLKSLRVSKESTVTIKCDTYPSQEYVIARLSDEGFI